MSVEEREEQEGATLRDDAAVELTGQSSSISSQRQSTDQLPLITVLPTGPSTNIHNGDKERLALEEARRLEKKKRVLEKIKHAQERARARVVRTNQLEQQQARSIYGAEQQQTHALSTAKGCARRIRRAQESRRFANERIQMKRQVNTPQTTPLNTVSGTSHLKLFHRKALGRLQVSSLQISQIERVGTPERNEDITFDQKLMERKCRQETAARLRRMKQMADNQKRQEQEEFEQGLQKFKDKLRAMDRVAKGMSRQSLSQTEEVSIAPGKVPRWSHSDLQPTLHFTKKVREEIFPSSADMLCPSLEMMRASNQDGKSSSDSVEANNPVIYPDQTEVPSPRMPKVNTHRRKGRCKLPVWKQLPVPLQPIECYSYKVIVPVD